MLGGLPLSHTAPSKPEQESSVPSPEAIRAARDLTYEALVETAALAESDSRSLVEAAWRADSATVETHLRQLRACVVAAIDVFKMPNGVEKKGGGA
jgi:hypothetical protein